MTSTIALLIKRALESTQSGPELVDYFLVMFNSRNGRLKTFNKFACDVSYFVQYLVKCAASEHACARSFNYIIAQLNVNKANGH